MNEIPSVDIDPSGRFKYILIKLRHNGQEKFIVRGHSWAEYHGISEYNFERTRFFRVISFENSHNLKRIFWINSRALVRIGRLK